MTTNPLSQVFSSLLGSAERRVAAVAIAVALAAAAIGFRSWLDARDDRAQMAATIASQNSIISAAEKREQDRAQQLADTLKQIAVLKSSVQSPQQVIREIPQYLPPLPQPLETIAPKTPAGAPAQPGEATAGASGAAKAGQQLPAAPDVRVPSADLKPLFDYVQDCRACQAKLAAAQQDSQDERTKNDALTKERDAAVKAAKGGSVWTRTVRVVKWVAVGFAVGYLAHAATH
jgi:hypothetical protein